MAKLFFTAAALFLLFAFSHARTPSDLIDDNQIPVTDANPTKPSAKTLFLPSERSGSETKTAVELEPEVVADEQKLPEAAEFTTIQVNEVDTADASKSETAPLTVISFRPVGRHFPLRPFPLTSRHGRPCRHGRRQWSSRFHDGEAAKDIHYGNDMILSSGDEMKLKRPSGGVMRQIPARWVNFLHGGPRSPFKHDDDMESERPRHHHRRYRHHEHEQEFEAQNEGEEVHREHKHDHDHEHRHDHEHDHKGGVFRNIRKFLNRF